MEAIKRILVPTVPTDFSAHADDAFRVAHSLARALRAEEIVSHVTRPLAVVTEGGAVLAEPGQKPTDLWQCFRELHMIRMIAARWLGLSPAAGRVFFCRPAGASVLGFEHDRRDQPILNLWNYISAARE
jgi:hypothetical protein